MLANAHEGLIMQRSDRKNSVSRIAAVGGAGAAAPRGVAGGVCSNGSGSTTKAGFAGADGSTGASVVGSEGSSGASATLSRLLQTSTLPALSSGISTPSGRGSSSLPSDAGGVVGVESTSVATPPSTHQSSVTLLGSVSLTSSFASSISTLAGSVGSHQGPQLSSGGSKTPQEILRVASGKRATHSPHQKQQKAGHQIHHQQRKQHEQQQLLQQQHQQSAALVSVPAAAVPAAVKTSPGSRSVPAASVLTTKAKGSPSAAPSTNINLHSSVSEDSSSIMPGSGNGKSVCSCGSSVSNGLGGVPSGQVPPIASLQAVQALLNSSQMQLQQQQQLSGLQTAATPQQLQTLKTGYLYRYKKRLLNKDWRREYCVLLNDSSLIWFKDGDRRAPAGRLVLRDAPQLIAYGAYTNKVPLKPSKLPPGYTEDQLLVFGEVGRSKRGFVVTVHWFLTEQPNHTLDWINAIINTIPTPPPPPYSEKDELQRGHSDLRKQHGSGSIDKLANDLKLMNIKESSIRKEKSATRSRSLSKGASPGAAACGTGAARSSSRKARGVDAEEAAMNAALNAGTTTGWGRGSGWSVQGDPAQILCYYAAAEAAIVDLSASDLAFDIPADLGDLDIGDSMFGDFGDAGAMDFGGFF